MEREFIVLCGEHYNPLGIIRSCGEAGIKPIAIVKKNEFQLTSKSKYIKKLHFVNSIEEGFNLLLETYANEKCPPYVYTADDKTMTHIDQLMTKYVAGHFALMPVNREELHST